MEWLEAGSLGMGASPVSSPITKNPGNPNGLSGSILFRTEGYRAVLVRNQDGIAGDAGSALVAVGEWLDVG